MAKKSKVVKELKRQALVQKYAEKRRELKEKGDIAALQKAAPRFIAHSSA